MLLFSSRTFTVDGVTVFPDHKDPNQFWYLPAPVGLETEANSTEPQFLLIMYEPDVAAAGVQGMGFLNVTMALKVSDQTQSKIVGEIRTNFPEADNPLLAPVPFDEGTVQIVALNLQGSGGTADTGTPGPVQGILGASNPELFGNNDALFALTLDERGATILEQAFQDGMTPVGGIYNLKFTGVLPALDVKITCDMKRSYQSFSVALTGSYYSLSAGIDATFEKLRQDGVIKVEIVSLSNDASTQQQEQWALNLFKDQILAQWFTPSLSPTTAAAADASSVSVGSSTGRTGGTSSSSSARSSSSSHQMMGGASSSTMGTSSSSAHQMGGASSSSAGSMIGSSATPSSSSAAPSLSSSSGGGGGGGFLSSSGGGHGGGGGGGSSSSGGGGNGVGKLANSLANAIGTAGAASQSASPFGASLRLKYVNQDELKTVEIEFNAMSALQRVFSPQGYFGLLLQGIDQSKHFLKVAGNDPFFNKFLITVNPPRDFTGIGLASAHVALDYGDPATTANPKHTDFIFDQTHASQQTWDVFEGFIQSTSYTYTTDYVFAAESGWQGEQTTYQLPAVKTENRLLTLDPNDFLGFLQLSVSPGRINADLVDRIEVAVQYTAKSGWQTAQTFVVKAYAGTQYWKLRLADKDDRTYTYTTNCYLKDGTLIAGPSVTSTASAIIVSDPFVGGINLTLQPAFDTTVNKLAIVELSYQDTAHGYSFQKTIELPAGSQPVPVNVPFIDRTQNTYQYRVTLISNTNAKTQGSYISAQDPLVLVSGP
jgi:hypothetical protein